MAIVDPKRDNELFRGMLERICENFKVREVYGDKLYCTKKNYEFARKLNVEAYFLFKKNATGRSANSAYEWHAKYELYKRDTLEFREHYNRRTNVESVFASIKATLSPVLRAKDRIAQTNEILLRVFIHNLTILHKVNIQYGMDIDPRPLPERNIPSVSFPQPATPQPAAENSSEIPILAKPEKVGGGMPKYQVVQDPRKCVGCGSIHTRKKKKIELWYHYKHGSEWYCHRCFFRKEMRDRKKIRKSDYRRV